ncbi:hypothetical protein ACQCVP_07375 [Rossellomorea vietnamensis]|uniref:hypothetical protein n=1 Tax=Rossellomorea vietnamensis TaxID=218284 RepID=UPI003CEF0604
MKYILLGAGVIVLLFSLRNLTLIEQRDNHSITQEIRQNVRLLLYGIPLIGALAFIPYQVWVITGKSEDWDGMFIMGGTAITAIILSYFIYYKRKLKFN